MFSINISRGPYRNIPPPLLSWIFFLFILWIWNFENIETTKTSSNSSSSTDLPLKSSNKNENLTSSESVLNIYDINWGPKLLLSDNNDQLNIKINSNNYHEQEFSSTPPVATALVDPDPLILSSPVEQPAELMLDYFYQQPLLSPPISTSSFSFSPSASYSLDEFSSFGIPSLDSPTLSDWNHQSTDCSNSDDYLSSDQSRCSQNEKKLQPPLHPSSISSSEPENCRQKNHTTYAYEQDKIEKRRDDHHDHGSFHQGEDNEHIDDDDDDTSFPYDPFEYLNKYRKSLHEKKLDKNQQQKIEKEGIGNQQNHIEDPDVRPRRVIEREDEQKNSDEPTTLPYDNENNDEDNDSEQETSDNSKNDQSEIESEMELDLEPDRNYKENSEKEEHDYSDHNQFDTMTATRNEPDNLAYNEDQDLDDQDYHESFKIPIRYLFANKYHHQNKTVPHKHNTKILSPEYQNQNLKTRKRLRRSLRLYSMLKPNPSRSSIETEITKSSKIHNQKSKDLETSSSHLSIFPNFILPPMQTSISLLQYPRSKPMIFHPILMQSDHFSLKATTGNLKYREFHQFPYPHYHVYYKSNKHLDQDSHEHRNIVALNYDQLGRKLQRPSYDDRSQHRKVLPVVYTNLDESNFNNDLQEKSWKLIRRQRPVSLKRNHPRLTSNYGSRFSPIFLHAPLPLTLSNDYGSSLLNVYGLIAQHQLFPPSRSFSFPDDSHLKSEDSNEDLPMTEDSDHKNDFEQNSSQDYEDNVILDPKTADPVIEPDYDYRYNGPVQRDRASSPPFHLIDDSGGKQQINVEYFDDIAIRKLNNIKLNNNYKYGYGF